MKNIIILTLALFAITNTVKAGQSDTVKIKTQIYCDHCMKCGSCWPKMEKELTFTSGVKAISFDDKTMVITVIYNSKKTSAEKLRVVISKSGFDADDVKADVKVQERLDGCCKKQ